MVEYVLGTVLETLAEENLDDQGGMLVVVLTC